MCTLSTTVLVVEGPAVEENLAAKTQAFVASEVAYICSVTIGDDVGGGALGKQFVQYIADSVATCNMTPDVDGRTSYREFNRPLGFEWGGDFHRGVR